MFERYFIGPSPNGYKAALNINAVIFGDITKQRENNQKNKIIVMLPLGDTANHPSLNAFQEYDYAGILLEVQKDEWQNNIINL
jgi:hypothetical protein